MRDLIDERTRREIVFALNGRKMGGKEEDDIVIIDLV
jgi:hypothetical protein